MQDSMIPRLEQPSTGMRRMDRRVWAAGMRFVAYGVRIGIRTNDPEMLDKVGDALPPGWRPAGSPVVERLYSVIAGGARHNRRSSRVLYADATRLVRTPDVLQLLHRLESDLSLYVATEARRRVFVHAGVVGWRGKAILLPGSSFSGKSTLVAELVRAGATYYSDEYAVLDAQGRVFPFARPLSMRAGGKGVARSKRCSAEALGGRLGVRPLPIGLVVVSHYKEGARWRPRQVSAGQGTLRLLANTVPAQRRPKAVLATLRKVVRNAPVLEGLRGEAKAIAPTILKTVDELAGLEPGGNR